MNFYTCRTKSVLDKLIGGFLIIIELPVNLSSEGLHTITIKQALNEHVVLTVINVKVCGALNTSGNVSFCEQMEGNYFCKLLGW